MFNLRGRYGEEGILGILKPQENHEIHAWVRETSTPLEPHHLASTSPIIALTAGEPYMLYFLLRGCPSKSVLCKARPRSVHTLLGAGKWKEGSLDLGGRGASVPGIRFPVWPGVGFIIGCRTLQENLQGNWYPGGQSFPGIRLPQSPLHGRPSPPVPEPPPKQPGSPLSQHSELCLLPLPDARHSLTALGALSLLILKTSL